MHERPSPSRDSALGAAAATASLVATLVTGAACLGPLLAIVLGIGGLGWLTRYAHLRGPASALTAVLLACGFVYLYRRERAGCGAGARRRTRLGRILLWTATALAAAINLFEYVVVPRLG